MNPHPTSVNNVDYISNLNSQSSSSLQQQQQKQKQKVSQKAMAASKLSAQDWKDLDKFINYLALKTVQVIVQARLGEKTRTKSKPHSSGSDWFNLAIRDLPEVQAEAKKALAGVFPSVGLSMCVEISLKTVEGDSMVLETWCVAMNEQCNNSVRVTHTVYSRLGLLLKSLISVTRVTPAYKLATRQGPDSFIICYRVYMGEPQLKFLGEGHSIVRVGQVTTPVGTVVLSVAYRTRLTLTPQKTIDRDGAIMVKSDHFKPDMSPKQFLQPTHVNCQPDHRSMVDELAAALEEGQPPDGEQTATTNENCAVNATLVTECVRPVRTDADHRNGSSTICKESNANLVDTGAKKVGAFAGDVVQWNNDGGEQPNREFFMPEAPFGNLLRRPDVVSTTTCQNERHAQQMSNGHGNNNHSNFNADALKNVVLNHDGAQGDVPGGNSSRRSSMDSSVAADDFVLVDLKPAFVGTECGNELGTFYRECQSAPQLVSFGEQPSLAAQVNDLSHQLATFETRQVEFDEFVDALYLSDSSK